MHHIYFLLWPIQKYLLVANLVCMHLFIFTTLIFGFYQLLSRSFSLRNVHYLYQLHGCLLPITAHLLLIWYWLLGGFGPLTKWSLFIAYYTCILRLMWSQLKMLGFLRFQFSFGYFFKMLFCFLYGLHYRSVPVYRPAVGTICTELYRAYWHIVY